ARAGPGAGGPRGGAPAVAELGGGTLDRLLHGAGDVLRRDADVLLVLGVALEDRRRAAQRAAVERGAEHQRRGQTVTGDVIGEMDDVTGLLAAEDAALPLERLEHVAVPDVGGD